MENSTIQNGSRYVNSGGRPSAALRNFSWSVVTVATCLAGAFTFSKCGSDKQIPVGLPINLFGGIDRSCFFGDVASFIVESYTADFTTNSDGSALDTCGLGTPVLPLSSTRYYTITRNGSVSLVENGRALWSKSVGSARVLNIGTCADATGNLYVPASDDCVYAFSEAGTQLWKYSFKDSVRTEFKDLLALKDGIIVATSAGRVTKLGFDGKVRWTRFCSLSPERTLAGKETGTVALTLSNNEPGSTDSLLLLENSGSQSWEIGIPNTRLIGNPVMWGDRIIVAGIRYEGNERTPMISSVDQRGYIVWSKACSMTPAGISVSDDGTIYVTGLTTNALSTTPRSAIAAYTSNGSDKWELEIETELMTPAYISEGNLAVVGIKKTTVGVYTFSRETGVLMATLSLHDAPAVAASPSITPDGTILLPCSKRNGVLRLGESMVSRIFPW